jgi:hypothetical protein
LSREKLHGKIHVGSLERACLRGGMCYYRMFGKIGEEEMKREREGLFK